MVKRIIIRKSSGEKKEERQEEEEGKERRTNVRARENGRKSKAVRTKATTKWMAPNHKVRAAIEWIGEAFCLPWNTVSVSPTPLLLPHSSFLSSVSIPFFIYYPEHRFFQHPDTNLIPTKQGPSTSLYIHSQRSSTTIDICHRHLSWVFTKIILLLISKNIYLHILLLRSII